MTEPTQLIHAYIDGTLDDAGFEVLCDWLREHEANRYEFTRAVALHSGIADWVNDQSGGLLMPELSGIDRNSLEDDTPGLPWIEALAALDDEHGLAEPVDLTQEMTRRTRETKAHERHRRHRIDKLHQHNQGQHRPLVLPKPLVWLGVAAALGVAAWVVTVLSTHPASTNQHTAQRPDTPANPGGEPVEPAARVASLGGSVDAVWADGYAWQPGAALHADQRLELVSGFAEVTTTGGTVLTIEGPCELTLSAADTFAVAHGRLMVETRDAAGPVTVRTPSGAVVHERAAFGLDIAANDDTRVVVFGGRVDLFGTDARGGLVGTDPFEVSAGRVAFAASGDLSSPMVTRAEPADRAAFAPSLAEAAAPSFRYRRAVLSSGPVAYWTFDEDVDEGVPNLADPGTHDLRAHGRPVQEADGVSGGAARLDNLLPPYSYFETANAAELLGGYDEFTFELWFRAERRHFGSLLDLYVAQYSGPPPHMACIEVRDAEIPDGHHGQWTPFSVRGFHRDPPGISNESTVNLYSPSPYHAMQWNHVALTMGNGVLRLYINGRPVSESADTGRLFEQARLILGISANIHLPGERAVRAFSGWIDEIAVYNRALTEDEVSEHYQAGSAATQ